MLPKLTDAFCETRLASESCWSLGNNHSEVTSAQHPSGRGPSWMSSAAPKPSPPPAGAALRRLTWLHFMLEFPGAMVYLPGMSQTLEQRVEDLEKKVAELSAEASRPTRKKDWRRTIGIFKDDPDFEEAVRLGREYRQQQTYEKEIAGS